MTDASSRCPCGTGLGYAECCGPLHSGTRRAATAEQLMRSRYSAYAIGDADYVLASWHPSTRPAPAGLAADADADADAAHAVTTDSLATDAAAHTDAAAAEPAVAPLVWRRLDIVAVAAGGPFDNSGTVEFRAVWRQGAERGELHERSRFVRVGGRWCYVDGDVVAS